MERTPIQSSNIISVGYEKDKLVLEIEFKNGIYQYSGVSEDIYLGLINASSAGRYFHAHIKDKYSCHQVA